MHEQNQMSFCHFCSNKNIAFMVVNSVFFTTVALGCVFSALYPPLLMLLLLLLNDVEHFVPAVFTVSFNGTFQHFMLGAQPKRYASEMYRLAKMCLWLTGIRRSMEYKHKTKVTKFHKMRRINQFSLLFSYSLSLSAVREQTIWPRPHFLIINCWPIL